jgi:hypothetical protein
MAQLNAEQIIAHLKSIEKELISNRDEYEGGSSGATWLKNRMLGRATGYLKQAIAELEYYQQPDSDLDTFGRNLKILEDHSD